MKYIIIIILTFLLKGVKAQDMYATSSSRAMERYYKDTASITIKEGSKSIKANAIYIVHEPSKSDSFHIAKAKRVVGYTTMGILEIYKDKNKWYPKKIKIGTRPKTLTIKP